MKIEEQLAQLYVDRNNDALTSIITKAYIEGYKHGLKEARVINIDDVRYYDLGLPSGTLWSQPIYVKHQYSYVTYNLISYYDACDLELPSPQDFEELKQYCMVTTDARNIAQDVVIIGPSGQAIHIGTKDYRNNPSNPNSMLCHRQGQEVVGLTNKFWLKSDVHDNHAVVALVDYKDKSISLSSHFIGYKLPYLLVKKPK